MPDGERRLAAIMFTDMVGYTALGQRNESLSLALVEEQRKLVRPILSRHDGREIKTMGDAFLVEFPNALDAVRCAYDIQRATREFNISLPPEKRIHLRVGLHLGDVVESKGDISGDAVNVASRIEPLAEDGGVCLTRHVYEQVEGKFDLPLTSLGPKALKNVSNPIEVYKVVMPWEGPVSSPKDVSLSPSSIAILPFANYSPDPNDEYFAEGITDEIISAVSGISGLSVISRTSVMGYKGTTKKIREIGRELEVGSVLEGSFKKAGNRIRVTTQLIDVAGDRHLWAQNYDRDLDDVFEVQSDIAKQVADALRVRILSSETERIDRRPTESAAAYSLYLKGRYYWNKRDLANTGKAREYFELAVHEDPSFALGFVGQADCCMALMFGTDFSVNSGIDRGANMKMAREMLTRALELDPGLAEAHATMGHIFAHEFNPQQAEVELMKAIELKPSYSPTHLWYSADVLLRQLRWVEALEEIEKAVELDPLSSPINFNHARYYSARRDYDRALELCKRVAALDPRYSDAHWQMAVIYGRTKMYDDMKREFATAMELMQGTYPLVKIRADARAAHLQDDKQTVRRLLPELESRLQETGAFAYDVACLYFFLGENDKGFEWLNRSCSAREGSLLEVTFDPDLDGVRNDPRYLDLMKRLGLD